MTMYRCQRFLGLLLVLPVLLVSWATRAEQICASPSVSGPPVWPPFLSSNEKGERSGIAFDIAGRVLGQLDRRMTIAPAEPWGRVLRGLETGRIDMIVALLDNAERREKFIYTEAWGNDVYGIVMRAPFDFAYRSTSDLDGLTGARFAGVRLPEPFAGYTEEHAEITKISHIPALYNVLHRGRVDYLIVSIPAFFHLLPSTYHRSDFAVVENSEVRFPVYMAISRKSDCSGLVSRINEVIPRVAREMASDLW